MKIAVLLISAIIAVSEAYDLSGSRGWEKVFANLNAPSLQFQPKAQTSDVATKDLTWTPCGGPEDLLEIKSLTYNPTSPVRGQPLTVNAQGYLKDVLDSGSKVNLLVKWGYVRVPVPPVDVCKELSNLPDAPYKCPVQPGNINVSQTFTLPTDIPDGNFDVTIRIKNQDGRQVTCVKVNLSF